MKVTYEEFNELQTQQKIRDYAQEAFNILICLNQIIEEKHNKQIIKMKNEIKDIENEAVENIRKMIEVI